MAKNKNNSIKIKLIVIPLFVVLIGIAIIGFTSSYYTRQSLLAEMEATGLKQSTEFLNRIEDNSFSIGAINNQLEDKIRLSGNIIKQYNSELDNAYIKILAKELGVDELNYYDNTGTIIYSNIDEFLGYVAEEGTTPYIFNSMNQSELMEDIRQNEITEDYYKYGYTRNDKDGFIQVGILADNIHKITDRLDHQTLLEEIASSDDVAYALLVNKNVEVIGHSDKERIGLSLTDDIGLYSAAFEETPYANKRYYEPEDINVYSVNIPALVNGKNIGAISIGYSMENVQTAINKSILSIIASGIFVFIILTLILFTLSNQVIRVIDKLKKQVAFMAKGDFSKDIPKDLTKQNNELGEISRAISTMQDSMKDIIGNILEACQQLAASSEELTATSQQSATAANEVAKVMEDISHGASDQAIETEKGHISISQLGDLLVENEDFIVNLNNTSAKIDQLKDEGLRTLEELTKQTNLSGQSANEVQKVIENTNESAGKIASASQMIQSIADQTNLLALNATIEAARAGEAGQGFAVVANEIKQLADQSSQFTEEINTIIGDLNEKTSQAVKAMQIGAETFAIQAGHVDTTSNQFYGIAETIDEIKEATKQVNQSSKHMTNQKEIILSIMEELSAISQENAAGSQEASASVEEQTASTEEIANSSNDLAKLAEELNQRMNQFTII